MTSSWFWPKSKLLCRVCGSLIVVNNSPTLEYCDYHCYCSNHHCDNHVGEDIGDMDEPSFAIEAKVFTRGYK